MKDARKSIEELFALTKYLCVMCALAGGLAGYVIAQWLG